MRAVVQRVLHGKVTVAGETAGEIGPGLVVLLGVGLEDAFEDATLLAEKVVNLRIFEDSAGKLNCSVLDLQYSLLIVSQFTLFGDCRKGRRPSFSDAAPPELAESLYEAFCEQVKEFGLAVAKGRFRTQMVVELANHGPVTILLDSKRRF
jgi:D-aminoacyl-tRNA deacylase